MLRSSLLALLAANIITATPIPCNKHKSEEIVNVISNTISVVIETIENEVSGLLMSYSTQKYSQGEIITDSESAMRIEYDEYSSVQYYNENENGEIIEEDFEEIVEIVETLVESEFGSKDETKVSPINVVTNSFKQDELEVVVPPRKMLDDRLLIDQSLLLREHMA